MNPESRELLLPEGGEQQFVADLFHALNQPLSALRCMLELATNSPRTPADYQEYFKVGLEKVELANLLTQSMREFLEAKNPGATPGFVSLQDCLREAADHFRPVAREGGVEIVFQGEHDFHTCSSRAHLQKALFYIFDFSFSFIRGKTLQIKIEQRLSQLICGFIFAVSENDIEKLWTQPFSLKELHWEQRLKWTIAQQLLRAEHGDLKLSQQDQQLRITASVPLVQPAI